MALSKLKTEEVNEAHATHDDECGGAGECDERTEMGGRRKCFRWAGSTEQYKSIPVRFREWLAEILRQTIFLGWAVEHLEGDSQNLAGMFLPNSVHA